MGKKKKTANVPRRRPVSATTAQAKPNLGQATVARLTAWSPYVALLALAAVLILSASLRGLYFRVDQLYVGIIVLIVGAFALLFHRMDNRSDWEISYTDIAVAGFVVFSWLSLLWAAEVRLALQAALVYTIAGLLYLFARSRGEGEAAPALLWGLGGIAVASWLMAGAVWNYPAAVIDVDRLAGPFQYPDTAGAVYLAAWLGAAGAQFVATRREARLLWGGLAGLAAYLFALSLSRGAWVVAPLAIVGLLGVSPMGRRIGALAGVIVLGLAAFVLAGRTFPHLVNAGSHYALLYGALAAVIGAIITEGLEWAHRRELDRWQVALATVIAILVLGGGALAMRARSGIALAGQTTVGLHLSPGRDTLSLQLSGSGSAVAQIVSLDHFGTQTTIGQGHLHPGDNTMFAQVPKDSTGARLLSQGSGSLRLDGVTVNGQAQSLLLARAIPQSIYHRLIGISGSDLSVWERIDFWRDGMKIFAQSPLIGWGGNAWRAIYLRYQSFNYTATQAHSSLVDAADSYGIFGIAFIALLAASLVFALRRAWGKGDWAGIALVVGGTLFLHSLIDFDLSIASALLLLWVALGAMPRVRIFLFRDATASMLRGAGILAGALAVWVIILSVAAGIEDAVKPPTLAQLQQAASMDPLSSRLRLDIAQQELQQKTSSNVPSAAAMDAAAAAYRLDPYNQYAATLEAQMLIYKGQPAAALTALKVAEQDQPMYPTMYQNYIDLADSLVTRALNFNQKPAARIYLRDAGAMWESFQRNAAETTRVAPQNLQMPPATPQLQLYAGEAAALLGKPQAVPLLQAALAGGQTTAKDWLAALGKAKVPVGQDVSELDWLAQMGVRR